MRVARKRRRKEERGRPCDGVRRQSRGARPERDRTRISAFSLVSRSPILPTCLSHSESAKLVLFCIVSGKSHTPLEIAHLLRICRPSVSTPSVSSQRLLLRPPFHIIPLFFTIC